MSEAHDLIQALLDLHLAGLPELPRTARGREAVAWENRVFPTQGDSLPRGGLWLRPSFLPAPPVQSTLGIEGFNRLSGLYQVSIFAPAGQGSGPARQLAGLLLERFARGLLLEREGLTLRVGRVGRAAALVEPDWHHLPVTVDWTAFALNPPAAAVP